MVSYKRFCEHYSLDENNVDSENQYADFCEKEEFFKQELARAKTDTEMARVYGLSRQTYQNRLKTWKKFTIDGDTYLINPKQMMKVLEDE